MPTEQDRTEAAAQLVEQRRLVDFDVAELTIELIVLKFQKKEIVVPDYQRQFVWSRDRKSKLLESLLLGLPIPFIFVADVDGDLEIVDGTQRTRTLCSFLNDEFALVNLEILHKLNGFKFSDLPQQEQKRLKNRTVRMIILSSKADLWVRFEVFQRINSGPLKLTDAEFRKGAFPGPFYEMIRELAGDDRFITLCSISNKKKERGESEELVLRFFAYAEKYTEFTHDVARFLNEFLSSKASVSLNEIADYKTMFSKMLDFCVVHLPNAFSGKNLNQTPRVRFEALAVGVHLALQQNLQLAPASIDWVEGDDFSELTRSDGSNSGPRLRARVEYVRDKLLETSAE